VARRLASYEFADRLLQMADSLEGGKGVPANARHALIAFVRNAYPKWTDFVESKIELTSVRPAEEIKKAVSVLTQKAETDGRMPERKPRNDHQSGKGKGKAKPQGSQTPATPNKPKPKPRQNKDKKRPAAEANVVERKKRVKFNHAPGSAFRNAVRPSRRTRSFSRESPTSATSRSSAKRSLRASQRRSE
jgi:hypothetical protein